MESTQEEKKENCVILGKREWYDYVTIILQRLSYGPVTCKARGQRGLALMASISGFLVKQGYVDAVTSVTQKASFSKDGNTIDLPAVSATFTRKV
jgi:hypothetical protein